MHLMNCTDVHVLSMLISFLAGIAVCIVLRLVTIFQDCYKNQKCPAPKWANSTTQ